MTVESGLNMDQELFREFYDRTAKGLWRFIYQGCGNATASDDILQEAYMKFLRYVDPEREMAEWKAYLYRIAGSAVITYFRRNRVHGDEVTEVPCPDSTRDREMKLDMQTAMSRLDERQRDMLWLAHVEGFSHAEISGILGVAENSVRVLLHRARGRLKALLAEQGIGLEETI